MSVFVPGVVSVRGLLVSLAVLAAVGCTPVLKERGQSPLRPPRMSADSMVLDIFFVRVDADQAETCEALWREVDEQHFPPECRRRLLENGLRAGVLGGTMPVALSELMELAGKPVPTDQLRQTLSAQPAEPPRVTRRHVQLREGSRVEIVTSDARDEMPILLRDRFGRLGGRTYAQAQPQLAATLRSEADGRARLELVPQIEHGPLQQRWVGGNEGTLRFEAGRRHHVFDELALEAELAPGHMVVVSSLPSRPGSLGHQFFSDSAGGGQEQKLLIVRLSQTQPSSR